MALDTAATSFSSDPTLLLKTRHLHVALPVLVLAGLTLCSWTATGTFVVLQHWFLIDEGEMIAERHGVRKSENAARRSAVL